MPKKSLNRKLYEQIIIKIYLKELLKNLILKSNLILVEVYDNSHIQEQIVLVLWLLLVMKDLLKKDIENLILKLKVLNKMICNVKRSFI